MNARKTCFGVTMASSCRCPPGVPTHAAGGGDLREAERGVVVTFGELHHRRRGRERALAVAEQDIHLQRLRRLRAVVTQDGHEIEIAVSVDVEQLGAHPAGRGAARDGHRAGKNGLRAIRPDDAERGALARVLGRDRDDLRPLVPVEVAGHELHEKLIGGAIDGGQIRNRDRLDRRDEGDRSRSRRGPHRVRRVRDALAVGLRVVGLRDERDQIHSGRDIRGGNESARRELTTRARGERLGVVEEQRRDRLAFTEASSTAREKLGQLTRFPLRRAGEGDARGA